MTTTEDASEAVIKAIAAEREACAEIARQAYLEADESLDETAMRTAENIEKAIRSRR